MTPTKKQIQILLDRGITPEQIKRYSQGQLPAQTQQQGYSGIGSSVTNFGKDIAQAGYLMFGGQKKIDQLSKQYLANGDKLFQSAMKQTDKERKKSLLLQAQSMYNDAEKVGGDILGQVRTNKQIIGDALGTLGWVVSVGTPTGLGGSITPSAGLLGKVGLGKATSTVGGRLLMGTAVGAGAGGQSALNENKTGSQIAKATIGGGLLGLGIGAAIEGASYGIRKLMATKPVKSFIGGIYNRELKPPTPELQAQLKRNIETTGEKVLNAVDETGKPIYVGGYQKLQQQAENQIVKNSSLLKEQLVPYSSNTIKSSSYKDSLIAELEDMFGILDKQQIKTIEGELSKLPKQMNPLEILNQRQIVDSKIPDSFWVEANPQKSFLGNVRFALRGLLKNSVEELAPEVAVRDLNSKIGLALDVKDLVSMQRAIRAKGGGGGAIGFWRPIMYLLDNTFTNPRVTTRVAQGLKGLGQKSGNILGRNVTTKILTK